MEDNRYGTHENKPTVEQNINRSHQQYVSNAHQRGTVTGPRALKPERIHEGLWDCPYCSAKGIGALKKHCPSCGHPQDQGTKFYLAGEKKYLDETTAEKYGKGEDWDCPYCGSMNRYNVDVCANCGAPRSASESTYSTRPAEQETPKATPTRKRSGLKFLIIAAALIALLVVLFSPKNKGAELSAKAWTRSVTVESLTPVQESGWSVPNDGSVISESEQLHHYDQVFAGYQNVEVERSREVMTGYDYTIEDVDNGDGTFTEREVATPHYETEYYTEVIQEPTYAQVPVYQAYYVYEIERWVPCRTADSSGTTEEPYWADPKLQENEREGGRNGQYQVSFTGDKGKTYTALVSESMFNSLKLGSKYELKISGGSTVQEIEGVPVRTY